MANLIVICGPHAVGKMTVAESLQDKLRYKRLAIFYKKRYSKLNRIWITEFEFYYPKQFSTEEPP